jgi:hypothetical protein
VTDDDDDDDGAERLFGWLASVLVVCVIALMVAGTAYAVHRILMEW